MDRISLKLIGITYNQIESGVYALILQEEDGERRLPIIIGYPEAQAIECKMQEVKTPRPLTHDLMLNMLNEFRLTLREVWIHRLPNGVFAAELTLEGPRGEIRNLDSRSSDAIALAIRAGSPIFTSEELLQEVGFTPDKKKESPSGDKTGKSFSQQNVSKNDLSDRKAGNRSDGYSALPLSALQKLLDKAVEEEDYEEAGKIKREIDKRNMNNEK